MPRVVCSFLKTPEKEGKTLQKKESQKKTKDIKSQGNRERANCAVVVVLSVKAIFDRRWAKHGFGENGSNTELSEFF